MLLVVTLAILILNSSAKLFSSNNFEDDSNDVHQPKSIEPVSVPVEFVNRGAPLWILSLSGNDWMAPKLRLGNTTELEAFFQYVGPMMKDATRIPPPGPPLPVRVKKDDPEKQTFTDMLHGSINDIKKNFMIMINKFALSSTIEPDAYIMDNTHYDNDPSITLHFKGLYAIMIVELGRKQWNYVIKSRSSLPEWFYKRHDTRDNPILVPEDVRIQLFNSLWRLLHVIFGLPD